MEKISTNQVINTILINNKITDILEERGISPVKTYGNRTVYICPIHEGDSAPSFMVFTDEKGNQTYHCFGCHSGSDVINLICALDNISIKQAIKKLLKDLKIEVGDITDSLIEEIIKISNNDNSKEIEILLLKIGTFCRKHLNNYKDDDEEKKFFLKIYKDIDELSRIKDKEGLEDIYEFLLQEGIPKRIDICRERQEQKELEKIKNRLIWK